VTASRVVPIAGKFEGLMRILVADDHESVRKGVRAILASRDDLQVCGEAENGQRAIEMAQKLKPDLIILDINMPVLGGFAAAKEIQKLLPRVPILFFSMHDSGQFVEEAKKAGVQGFVAKDKAGWVLLEAVDALLNNNRFFPV
jgi:DNA-binding NarL/FixJ family response regulator